MRLIAIHTGPDIYLDHIGVLASILKIPLIVTEPDIVTTAQFFYPQLTCILKDPLEFSLKFLADNYDAIIVSGHFLTADMMPLFDTLCDKKMRMIYCPHGNSDKGHSLKDGPKKDISLVYGKQMLDLLKKTGALKKISSYIICGNFRAHFYLNNKSFYDHMVDTAIYPHLDKQKKTLLYAPTWSDQENTSSFFDQCENIIKVLHRDFNLIIKLHPFLEEQAPAYVYSVIEKHKHTKNILFLSNFPPIYPLLNICDGYLGDFSSVGYDMLFFGKPMFFFGSNEGAIYKCGQEIPADTNPLTFIKENWQWNKDHFVSIRKKTYSYVFEEEPCQMTELLGERITQQLLQALLKVPLEM